MIVSLVSACAVEVVHISVPKLDSLKFNYVLRKCDIRMILVPSSGEERIR